MRQGEPNGLAGQPGCRHDVRVIFVDGDAHPARVVAFDSTRTGEAGLPHQERRCVGVLAAWHREGNLDKSANPGLLVPRFAIVW
jgi:hypothetical protein